MSASVLSGKFLRINLSTRQIERYEIPEEWIEKLGGGRGLGALLLYKEVSPGIDPLEEGNKLYFLRGPLAGTGVQGASRWIVMGKSPLTGCVGRAVGGGNFGAYLAFVGYDGIIIEGQSPLPVYLFITNDKVEILNGNDLWGTDTQRCQEVVKSRHGNQVAVACIGPAGEHQVRFAAIINQRRSASRCGLGTVMGAKNLKAVVLAPDNRANRYQSQKIKDLAQKQKKALKGEPRQEILHRCGTLHMIESANFKGWFPVRNFQESSLDGWQGIVPTEFSKVKVGNSGCFGCLTRCGQVHRIDNGPFSPAFSEGPEYESLWAFSGQVGGAELAASVLADNWCDALGLDTISTGNVIGFIFELYERGLLTPAISHGLRLEWGNLPVVLQLIQDIGHRKGLGNMLAEGVKRCAVMLGKDADKYAMHAKGLELPAYDPRAVKGYALSYAVSNIGGSHVYGRPREELYGQANRLTEEHKGNMIRSSQIRLAAMEIGINCIFSTTENQMEIIGEMLSVATGVEAFADLEYLDKVGERIVTLERCFNVREGIARNEDTIPTRFLTEPLVNAGEATGQVVKNLETMLDDYYSVMGYTMEGIPTEATVRKLGLTDVIKNIK